MLLKIGSQGEDVKKLQAKLGLTADGIFGNGTAAKVKEAFWGNTEYPDDLDEWNLANALREVINQLQQSPGVIMCSDLLELCEEIEKL